MQHQTPPNEPKLKEFAVGIRVDYLQTAVDAIRYFKAAPPEWKEAANVIEAAITAAKARSAGPAEASRFPELPPV